MSRRLFIVVALVGCLFSSQSLQADITGSSILQNQSGTADLDVAAAGLQVIDWAVFDNSGTHSNELAGGASDFGVMSVFNPTSEPTNGPLNRNAWTMNFSNAANGSPASGSTFGWGPEWINPSPDPGVGLIVSVTPNVATGTHGMITIYGNHNLGFPFGGQFYNDTMTVNGGGNAGDQAWSAAGGAPIDDDWIYSMTFDNYNGETFDFQFAVQSMSGLGPITTSIAAIQVQGVPEPATAAVLPILGLAMVGLRRSRKK